MQNHRPLQKQYANKRIVKHHYIPIIHPIESLPIHDINVNDYDRFGNKIKRGSHSGGSCHSDSLDIFNNVLGEPIIKYRSSRKRCKLPIHPDNVRYDNYYRNRITYSYYTYDKHSYSKLHYSGQPRRIKVNEY